jgi:hypothetical protein
MVRLLVAIGSNRLRASSCGELPLRPGCDGVSRHTNSATRMRSKWRTKACCWWSFSGSSGQPRHHVDLSPRHREFGDHCDRPRQAVTSDLGDRRVAHGPVAAHHLSLADRWTQRSAALVSARSGFVADDVQMLVVLSMQGPATASADDARAVQLRAGHGVSVCAFGGSDSDVHEFSSSSPSVCPPSAGTRRRRSPEGASAMGACSDGQKVPGELGRFPRRELGRRDRLDPRGEHPLVAERIAEAAAALAVELVGEG